MIGSMQTREDNEDFRNPIDLMFEDLEREKPDCFAVKQYKKFKLSGGKNSEKHFDFLRRTAGSVRHRRTA